MNWIPFNLEEPELNRPLLVTVIFQTGERCVTQTEYVIDSCSDINGGKTFEMGSAQYYKVLAWMYEPDAYHGNDGTSFNLTWTERSNRVCGYSVERIVTHA